MTRFSTATALLALSVAASTANADVVGGFQSGPSDGAFYSGGMTYIPALNRAMFTGSHYNQEIIPHAEAQANKMQGAVRDVASSCYLGKVHFDAAKDGDTYHSLTDWVSFGNPGKIETCSAVAGTKGSDAFVVGSVADGGLFSDGYPIQGLLSIIDKENLGFIDATLIKSADDPNKHMIYPLDVIHDYHRKFVYVAALTSADELPNTVSGNKEMPNWQDNHLLGSSFDVTVIKIKTPDGSKPEAIWVQHFPLEVDAVGNTPPVFVAGMALQTDMNGNQHLLVSGSTRGSGEAFGRAAPNSVDEDGFIMQLKLSDGSFIKHDRHQGQIYDYQDDLREGTPSDDFIRGICNNLGKGHDTHGKSDIFYVVGGTKGDMTTNSQGPQNENGNGGFQFGAAVESKYKGSWNRDESLMPFMRKVNIDTLKPVWTTQWAAMPKNTNAFVPTNAYAMDCYVDNSNKAIFVVGSVLKDAKMTQGDVEMINQGDDDIWVAKVDEETGNVFWLTQLGSTESDYVARRGSIAVNNEGNVIIYGDTNGSLYRPRDTGEDPANTDMFLMTIDGKTGAVMDDIYMGGTSSGSVSESINGIPPFVPPRPPTTSNDNGNSGNSGNSDNGSTTSNESEINKSSPKKSKAGTIFGIFFGIIFGLFALYFFMHRRMKRKKAEAQKSSIFACLQQFDVEDIDLRRSPPGGWHGTYMNKLAHGQNNADDLALESSGAEGAPLTHASVANDALFMDSSGGYTDNEFSIGEEDEVDIRLKSGGGVV